MAAIDVTRTVLGTAPVATRFRSILVAPITTFLAWNDQRKTRNALAALTDRELEDIGLIRGDIDSVVGDHR